MMSKKGPGTSLKMFPSAFTLVLSVLYVMPTYIVFYASHHRVVGYWISNWSIVLLVIPIVVLVIHYIHAKQGGPNKYACIIGIVLPSVLLLFSAMSLKGTGSDLETQLFSTDCDTIQGKRKLQRSWQAAYNLYMKCLRETATMHALNVNDLTRTYRIEDCDEYQSAFSMHSGDWSYLRMLEEEQDCSGWCFASHRLWSSGEAKDACSIAVSMVFGIVVTHHAGEVIMLMLLALLGSVVAFLTVGPMLRKRGYSW